MSTQTGTYTECIFSNVTDYTALASFTSEASLLAGSNLQPTFFPSLWEGNRSRGRVITIDAMGVFSNTGTPTWIFQARLGSTVGSTQLGGSSVGVSAAITTTSGVTNVWWRLFLRLICRTPGQGSGNTTIAGAGKVESPAGFATPFVYPLEPTTPNTATWSQTIDNSIAQYLNLSVTCSASSASNTITLKDLVVLGLN